MIGKMVGELKSKTSLKRKRDAIDLFSFAFMQKKALSMQLIHCCDFIHQYSVGFFTLDS
jgi:hypothetical protein